MQRLLDAAAAADMLAWENSGFSIDASVRIMLIGRDVPSYFRSLEHLLRYCARPPFALERLSVIRGEDGRIARVRYVLPRHNAGNWVGQGRSRKSTRPDANGVVELSPFEILDRLPISCRHRENTGTGTTASSRRVTRCDGPSRRWPKGNVGKQSNAATGGPPTDWGELVQADDDRDTIQATPDELPAIDIYLL